jgi:hypothetical protein
LSLALKAHGRAKVSKIQAASLHPRFEAAPRRRVFAFQLDYIKGKQISKTQQLKPTSCTLKL